MSTDLRASASLMLAGLVAQGRTEVHFARVSSRSGLREDRRETFGFGRKNLAGKGLENFIFPSSFSGRIAFENHLPYKASRVLLRHQFGEIMQDGKAAGSFRLSLGARDGFKKEIFNTVISGSLQGLAVVIHQARYGWGRNRSCLTRSAKIAEVLWERPDQKKKLRDQNTLADRHDSSSGPGFYNGRW